MKLIMRFFCLTSAVHDTKGSSKSFPKHETRHVSEHKVLMYRKILTSYAFSALEC